MTKQLDGKVDRIESAANITLIIAKGGDQSYDHYVGRPGGTGPNSKMEAGFIEVPISRLDTTKEVEISEVRESSLKATGYSITSISYSGTMMFKGSRLTKVLPNAEGTDDGTKALDDFLYDQNGVPKPVTINITHNKNQEDEVYEHVLVNSESYEVRSEEATETAYDWVAMDRRSDQPSN
jgi:hypothetical protein